MKAMVKENPLLFPPKEGYTATENAEYLEFIRLRGEQMLNDNKALTPLAKQEITQLMDWAASHTT